MVPFWTALNFPKRFVSGCREKVERGQELVFSAERGRLLTCCFCQKRLMKSEDFEGQEREPCIWVVLWWWGLRGRGCAFFPSL